MTLPPIIPPRAVVEAPRSDRPAAAGQKAGVEFEAFVLQSCIEAMLPKDAESVFGAGTAGGFWKSMLAEKLAMELALGGRLGIAAMVAPGAVEPNKGGQA